MSPFCTGGIACYISPIRTIRILPRCTNENYGANYWRGNLALTYQFPVKLKGNQTRWFVRAYGDYLRTQHSHLDQKMVGFSLGLYN